MTSKKFYLEKLSLLVTFIFSMISFCLPIPFFSKMASKKIFRHKQKMGEENIKKVFGNSITSERALELYNKSIESLLIEAFDRLRQFTFKTKSIVDYTEAFQKISYLHPSEQNVIYITTHTGAWLEYNPLFYEFSKTSPGVFMRGNIEKNPIYYRVKKTIIEKSLNGDNCVQQIEGLDKLPILHNQNKSRSKICSTRADGIRDFLTVYKKNGKGVFVSDYSAKESKRSCAIEFCGQKVYVDTLPFILAQKDNAIIISTNIVREGPWHRRYKKVLCSSPIKATKNTSIEDLAQKSFHFFEGIINKYPEQWMWMSNIWT